MTQVGDDDEEELVEEFPIIFKFYEDRLPHRKLQEIKVTVTTLFENIIVKQLLQTPNDDKFAVAFYSDNEQKHSSEPSTVLIFERDVAVIQEVLWKNPMQHRQRNYEREEKLINAFHVDTSQGQKFLLFRDETLLILNEANLNAHSTNSYMKIDEELIQCRVVKEDYGCIGETFLCAFQVLHSDKIKRDTPKDKLVQAAMTKLVHDETDIEEVKKELKRLDDDPDYLEEIIEKLNDKIQDELCHNQHKYSNNQQT